MNYDSDEENLLSDSEDINVKVSCYIKVGSDGYNIFL